MSIAFAKISVIHHFFKQFQLFNSLHFIYHRFWDSKSNVRCRLQGLPVGLVSYRQAFVRALTVARNGQHQDRQLWRKAGTAVARRRKILQWSVQQPFSLKTLKQALRNSLDNVFCLFSWQFTTENQWRTEWSAKNRRSLYTETEGSGINFR